ncbi:MAG: ATP-binding cassette domain-containing protein, partial [Planctomycetota bacterium]
EPLVLNPARGVKSPTRRLLTLIQPDRSDLWSVVIFAVLVGGLMLATPVAVQTLVNFVAFGASIPPLFVLSGLLLLGLGAAAFVSALQAWIVENLQRRIFVRVVADLTRRLPRVSRSVSDEHYAPELVNRFFDVMTVQKVSATLLLEGLSTVLGIVVGLVVLAFYHPFLLAFDLVLLILVSIVIFGPVRRGVTTAIRESKSKYAVVSWLEELARNPIAYRSGGIRPFIDQRSECLAQDYVTSRHSHFRVVFGQMVAALILQVAASTVLLLIGGLLVVRGELTLGQLVASELIVTVVVQSVAKMGKHIESYYDLTAAVDKLGQLIDLDTEESKGALVPGDSTPASLEVRDVALTNIGDQSLGSSVRAKVNPGESLAVVGEAGSGRSLLLEALYGLRSPMQGTLLIDDIDYRDVDIDALRHVVSLASFVEIIEGTVLENVTLGRAGISTAEVTDVLHSLGLLEEIRELPEGLGTRVSPSGAPLTDSQRRRLVLARTILSRPRLLLVDGLLDGLHGADREHAVNTVFRETRDWSLVIVTDREDISARCDRSIELQAPKRPVVASTTPDSEEA